MCVPGCQEALQALSRRGFFKGAAAAGFAATAIAPAAAAEKKKAVPAAGAKAPECAGVIHSDLQRGFIRAEVIRWDELLSIGSWSRAKEQGKLRIEGKEYEVADGDVLEIRFNV